MMAGPLDRRITLRRATVTTNELGEDVQTWADLATVWAQRADAGISEQVAGAETISTVSSVFRIRWSSRVAALTPRDRVLAAGREYDIVSVVEVGRREGIEFTAHARND